MHPDSMNISAYLDGELSPGEHQALEARLATDQELQLELRKFQNVREFLGQNQSNPLEGEQDRIWEKIQNGLEKREKSGQTRAFWSGKVVIPFPLAAAAALFLVLGSAFLGFSLGNSSLEVRQSSVAMKQFLEPVDFLDEEETRELVVDIPSDFRYQISGESQVIHLSSYNRSGR